jgi:hypothetical protein
MPQSFIDTLYKLKRDSSDLFASRVLEKESETVNLLHFIIYIKPVVIYYRQQKMEKKPSGVRKSLLKEVKLFPVSIKAKTKMIFNTQLRGAGSDNFTDIEIMTGDGRVFIPGCEPFHLGREAYTDEGPNQISIMFLEVIPTTKN